MDPITLGVSLLQFVPSLVKYFTGSDKDAAVAGKVVEIAKQVTGKDTGEAALEELKVSPDLVLAFRTKVLDQEVELEKIAQQAAAAVNATMVAEAASEHWPTYSWRPAIGFAVALGVIGSVVVVFMAYAAAIFGNNTKGLEYLPGILAAIAGIIGVVSPILGIASWYRGRMQADPNIPTTNKG